jgi:hypothetical protein
VDEQQVVLGRLGDRQAREPVEDARALEDLHRPPDAQRALDVLDVEERDGALVEEHRAVLVGQAAVVVDETGRQRHAAMVASGRAPAPAAERQTSPPSV